MKRLLLLSLALCASGSAMADDYVSWKAGQFPAPSPLLDYLAASNGQVEVHVQTTMDGYVGCFTIGTADGRYLMYGHSNPSTSWVKFQVDGVTQLPTLEEAPALVGDGIVTVWSAAGVEFTQTLTPTLVGGQGTVRIEYDALNVDTAPHDIGVLLQMDTQINWNDAAPISTSQGYAAQETCFDGAEVPLNWQAFEEGPNQDPSLLVGCGILDGFGATLPDRFAVGRWGWFYGADFNYACEPVGYGDSAVLLWWSAEALGAGSSEHFQTYYGTCSQIAVPGELSLSLTGTQGLSCDEGEISPNPFDVNLIITNTGAQPCTDVFAHLSAMGGLTGGGTVAVGDLDPGQTMQVGYFLTAMDEACGGYGFFTIDVTSQTCPTNTISREIYIPCCEEVAADETPLAFGLGANHPNPFNPSTTISFQMAETGHASLTVHNLAAGQVGHRPSA